MALNDSESKESARRGRYMYLYPAIFIIATSTTTVMLSIGGYISFDPFTAFVASLFAGFAFLLFQVTYVRFVVNSTQSARRREPQPDLQ
ncbi:MAG: hypothetical protein PVI03_08155 [Candidatus Thorarchaeota archaeon]|jgi:hypothetical protein